MSKYSEISKYDLEQRKTYVEKAKSASSFLDSVFYIHYYNSRLRFVGPSPKPDAISVNEVFERFNSEDLNRAIESSRRLMSIEYVGAAFHSYSNCNETYEEALHRMKNHNPGFCEECYKIAVNASIIAMR